MVKRGAFERGCCRWQTAVYVQQFPSLTDFLADVTERTSAEEHLMKFLENQHQATVHNKSGGSLPSRTPSAGDQRKNKSAAPPEPLKEFKDQGKAAESFSASRKHANWQLQQTMRTMAQTMNAVANQYRNAMKSETEQKVLGILLTDKRKAEKAARMRRDKRRVHFRLLKKLELQLFQVQRRAEYPLTPMRLSPVCLPASLPSSFDCPLPACWSGALPLCLPPCLPNFLSPSRLASLPPCSPCNRRRERCNFGLWACCCPWFGNSLPFRFGQVI